ncbi:MAG: hypothetical protein U9Q21_01015 [Candidatus Auribacterota bacterium]|nr:hypothetical protein [Candidatus Auribacterota bacterium]
MVKRTVLFFVIFLMSFNLHSDDITLKTGETVKCVVLFESDNDVTYETAYGKVSLTRERVENIVKASEKENADLRQQWENQKSSEEKVARLKRRKEEIKTGAKKKFEAQQKEKGLVKYKGKWHTKDELKQLIAEKKQLMEEKKKAREEANKIKKVVATEEIHEKMEKDAEGKSKAAKSYLLTKVNDKKEDTQYFTIYYKVGKSKDEKIGRNIKNKADRSYKAYISEMKIDGYVNWQTKCAVYIFNEERNWSQTKATAGPSDSTPYGFSASKQREIFIAPWGDTGLSNLSYTSSEEFILTANELFGYFLSELLWKEFLDNKNVALWLTAGTASYYSGTAMYGMEKLKKDIKAKKGFKFNNLIGRKKYPKSEKDFRRFVAQSEKLVEILIDGYGDEGDLALCKFARLMVEGESFNEAFDEVYGEKFESVKDFSKQWYDALRGK